MSKGQKGPENAKEKALWDAFQKFDVNGDGKIQAEEFHKLMKSLGSFSSKEIKRLFAEADSDNSGGVDWREFIKWICSGAATKTMSADSAASFARFLKHETRDEASFVEQAAVSKQLTAYLKEGNAEKSDAELQKELKRKQSKVKKKMGDEVKEKVPTSPEDLGISESYKGYRMPLPVTPEGAQGLMRHYLVNGDNEPLHPKYVNYLTTTFTNAYKARHPKPVVITETPKPGRLIVVGDTHGQLADVLHILHQLGPPTSSNRYLFNGDMVDRGSYGVEILLMLFSFFLADNDSIILHRGNHENEDMNALDADGGGGFIDEVMRKYGLMAYRRFVNAFKALSLCAVVEKEIFIVHGGLTRVTSLSIDYLNSIDHNEVTAPHPMATDIKDQVFSDLVWSDPTDQPGKYKSERGIGIKFGADITTKFCMQNRLRFVIRSHQVPEDGRGYMKQHDGRCVTIFSASNYCGDGGNYGAVLVLDSQHFPRYEIIEHYAAPLEDMPRLLGLGAEKVSIEQQKAEADAATSAKRWERELERMIVGVLDKKPALWAHVVDMSMGNVLSLEDWKDLVQQFVEGQHPWTEGAAHWGIVNKAGKVEMGKFLNRWIVNMESEKYSSFLTSAVKGVYEAVVALDMDLDKTLKLFDVDGDGTVELKEVRHVLGMFDLGLTSTQLDRLTGQIFSQACNLAAKDTEQSGTPASALRMNVQDFLGSFTVVYKQTGGLDGGGQLEPWIKEALSAIGRHIVKTPAAQFLSDLEKAALKIQKCFRGLAIRKDAHSLTKTDNPDEARVPSPAPAPTPAPAAAPAASLAPPTKRTSVGGAAARKSGAPTAAAAAVAGAPPAVLAGAPAAGGAAPDAAAGSLQSSSKMVALFRTMDVSGDGMLQTEEFVRGMEMVPGITDLQVGGKPLTHDRLLEMAKAIDSYGNGNGTINYLEFLQAFESAEGGDLDIANTLGEDITTVLFRHRLAIRMGCQYLDEEGTGKVKADDFDRVLHGVNSVLARPERMLTNTQISLLVEALKDEEDNGDDVVDYDAFLRSFVILDTAKDRAVVKRF